jgi:hypothetical protein
MHLATFKLLAPPHDRHDRTRPPMKPWILNHLTALPRTICVAVRRHATDDELLSEFLAINNEIEHPSLKLLATIHPSSKFRDAAIFSDLAGCFPGTAFDGSQYIVISQYKAVQDEFDSVSVHHARSTRFRHSIHTHLQVLQRPWPPNSVPRPRQRINARNHSCSSSNNNMSQCSVYPSPKKRQQGRTRHPDFSASFLVDSSGHSFQFPH